MTRKTTNKRIQVVTQLVASKLKHYSTVSQHKVFTSSQRINNTPHELTTTSE